MSDNARAITEDVVREWWHAQRVDRPYSWNELVDRITAALTIPPGHVRDDAGREWKLTDEGTRTDHEPNRDVIQRWCVLTRIEAAQAARDGGKGAEDPPTKP